jgi:hypothetical protein
MKINTHKQQSTSIAKTFNLVKDIHISTIIYSLLALNVKDHEFSPSSIKIE